ncbi:GIY-YIG nuclease family protein [Litoribacter ruber]|uniref:GIY-YIG nuclease family protein n=1 Tax=Litoribacter ruber TaxID=702568 RepID=UPI001BD9CE08|nr:GIY-YIG nuclease family protein [Litoribacter ruber]MBT0812963.1 GIY-YIG nuclease family protein [Litoribacter ruber]
MDAFTENFIKHHKLPKFYFFNAKGKTVIEVRKKMKKEGAYFAYNTTPCKNGEHRIRDRKGHCVVCNTAYITFMLRFNESGYIYIAGTIDGKMMKIGSTNNVARREKSLNKSKYANCTDWEIIYYFFCTKIGLFEYKATCKLSNHSTKIQYKHDGVFHMAQEIYLCSFKTAYSVIKSLQENIEIKEETFFTYKAKRYNFRNLIYYSKGENSAQSLLPRNNSKKQ